MRQRTALLIAYSFPPSPGIASVRMEGIAKYLPRFGWRVVVLTPRLARPAGLSYELAETGYDDVLQLWRARLGLERGGDSRAAVEQDVQPSQPRLSIRRWLVRAFETVVFYPDQYMGWRRHALDTAEEVLAREHIDAIISSYKPAAAHMVGSQLAQKYHIPWVADFRDLWTQNHYYLYGEPRRLLETRLERRTLSAASALTTVSERWAEKLAAGYPAKRVELVYNGFDPEHIVSEPALLDSLFTITYTGTLYSSGELGLVLEALSELAHDGELDLDRVRVDLYGSHPAWLESTVERYGLSRVVRYRGFLDREQIRAVQRCCQVLLLIAENHPIHCGTYTGKVYEYLAAMRPILAIAHPESVLRGLVEETHAGYFAWDLAGVKRAIRSLYEEFLAKGSAQYRGSRRAIEPYSHLEMARRFATLLDSLL